MKISSRNRARSRHYHGSGFSHLRYDHKHRPTKIECICPLCGGRAIAQEPAFEEACLIVHDISAGWDQLLFRVRCTQCMYRANGLGYSDLGEPFHQISVSGRTLWAWNSEHLAMLRKLLAGESIAEDPYGWFATYAQRGWLQWRHKFLAEIERHARRYRLAMPMKIRKGSRR